MSQKLASEDFQVLKKAWLQYVHEEKEKEGELPYLPKARRCRCDKSLTSFPHWPPTTYEEAIAQLNCLIGESFPHRLYLADCWMTSLYLKLAKGLDGIEKIISMIQDNFQSLDKSPNRPGTNKVDCRKICKRNCQWQLLSMRLFSPPGGMPRPSTGSFISLYTMIRR